MQVERLRWYNYYADDKLVGQEDEAWQLVDANVDDMPVEVMGESPTRGRTESPEREATTADFILAFTKSGGITLHNSGDGSGFHRHGDQNSTPPNSSPSQIHLSQTTQHDATRE